MSTNSLYCYNCKKRFNVRKKDLELMQEHDKSFNGKEYHNGCFFKDLSKVKKEKLLYSN